MFAPVDNGMLNDMWVFDGSAWTQLEPAAGSAVPAGRMHHTLSLDGTKLHLVGGVRQYQYTVEKAWYVFAHGSCVAWWRVGGVAVGLQ